MKSKINPTFLKYTQDWQNLISNRDIEKITKHLNSGFSFSISQSEYNIIKENEPSAVHYYLCIVDKEFKILVIDNVADKNKDHSNIFFKTLKNGIEDEEKSDHYLDEEKEINHKYQIKLKKALNRSFRWRFLSNNWLKHKFDVFDNDTNVKKNNIKLIFPVIVTPIEDLDGVFNPETETGYKSKFAYHFFGLKLKNEKNDDKDLDLNYQIHNIDSYEFDLIITNITHDTNLKPYFGDYSCMCSLNHKKYNKEHFSLLPTRF